MSKAFTKEATLDEPVIVRARAPLPTDEPNYVSRRGLSLLRAEMAELEHERTLLERSADDTDHARLPALATRIAELAARIGSAITVDHATGASDEIRFEAQVTVKDAAGQQRRYQIVGVDEAKAKEGRIAFVSPLARALLGRRVGDLVTVDTPRGDEELEVIAVSYDDVDNSY